MKMLSRSRTRRLLSAAGALLFLGAWAKSEGRPVPEGAQVELRFQEREYLLGQTLQATFVLTNAGTKPFTYRKGGDYRGTGFPTSYKVTIRDDKGEELPAETFHDMGGLAQYPELQPSEQFSIVLRLQDYVRIERPGVLTVRISNSFGWTPTVDRPLPVAEAKVEVRLPTAEEADALVQQAFRAEEEESRKAIGCLQHPVFLPALEKYAGAGAAQLCEAIHRIPTPGATELLVRLLERGHPEVMPRAALYLSLRAPPRIVDEYPTRLSVPGARVEVPDLKAAWLAEAAEPLRKVMPRLLGSQIETELKTGAYIAELLGDASAVPPLFRALEQVVEGTTASRCEASDNILNLPEPGDALVQALAGLRQRGYRVPEVPGSDNVSLFAALLEIGDAEVERRADWQQVIRVGLSSQLPLVREAAVQAIPLPLDAAWRDPLLRALKDLDYGVLRRACEAAGKSRDRAFVEPLGRVLREADHQWVLNAASTALTKLDAYWVAAEAWIERLASERYYPEALRFLASKLEHPATNSSSGRTDMPEARRLAMREKWRTFFAEPARREIVARGDMVPVTEEQARELFAGAFAWSLHDGTHWPAGELMLP